MTLRRRCLVSPIRGATSQWSILMSASQYQLRSKTGTSDDSVFWDAPGLDWFEEVLKALSVGNPDEVLWKFSYRDLVVQIGRASAALGVPFAPYMLRHSGPSWDRLKGHRTLAEIQKRGLRQSHKSVARHEQAARSASEYQKIKQPVRHWLEARASQLEQHMLQALPVPDLR